MLIFVGGRGMLNNDNKFVGSFALTKGLSSFLIVGLKFLFIFPILYQNYPSQVVILKWKRKEKG